MTKVNSQQTLNTQKQIKGNSW